MDVEMGDDGEMGSLRPGGSEVFASPGGAAQGETGPAEASQGREEGGLDVAGSGGAARTEQD